jgi:cell division protein FtsB
MKRLVYLCSLLMLCFSFAFMAEGDRETALEVSIEEEEIKDMQSELDELKAEKRAAKRMEETTGEYTPAPNIQGTDVEF